MLSARLYTSRASRHFDESAIDELIRQASRKNRENSITGYLCYKNHIFLQYFEGPEDNVSSLFKSIDEDPRHEIISSLTFDTVENRLFDSWSMRRIYIEEQTHISLEDVLRDVTESLTKPPYELDRARDIAKNILQKISLKLRKTR